MFGRLLAMGTLACCATPALAGTVTTSFTIDGAVTTPGSEDAARLAALPQHTQTVTYFAGASSVTETFTGPSLLDVVNAAGLQAPAGVKNGSLRDVIAARGNDGYTVAFSEGELDPKFGNRPDLVGITENGAPLASDGFARTVATGDAHGGRYVSNLAGLTVVQAPSAGTGAGGRSASFILSGLVAHAGSYDAAAIAGLPSLIESVTYTQGGHPVSASFTGTSLWGLLSGAGIVTDPAVKNQELRYYVLATGSDGYEATFSLGELDPRFGGTGAADLVATGENGAPLGTDGFARLVVPGDAAGGRYVSNLVSLEVLDVAAIPEPRSHALLLGGVVALAALRAAPRSRD